MEINNVIKIASVYIGVVLGAGFLSGQEILNFFVKYEYFGLIGCAFSGFAFYKIGEKVLIICNQNSIEEFGKFLKLIMGEKLGSIIEVFIATFMLILFATMLAGGGASINQRFGLEYTTGVCIIASIVFCIFLFDLNGLVKVNIILTPIMIVGTLIVGVSSILCNTQEVFNPENSSHGFISNWFVSALIYVSYNIATGIGVLTNLTSLSVNKTIIKKSCILSGYVMGILALLISISISQNGYSSGKEIPIMEILGKFSQNIQWFYFVVLNMAIITTAIGNGFAFIQWVDKNHKLPSIIVKIILVLFGVFLANFGFSNFVKIAYPILGVVGLIEIFFVFKFNN